MEARGYGPHDRVFGSERREWVVRPPLCVETAFFETVRMVVWDSLRCGFRVDVFLVAGINMLCGILYA